MKSYNEDNRVNVYEVVVNEKYFMLMEARDEEEVRRDLEILYVRPQDSNFVITKKNTK